MPAAARLLDLTAHGTPLSPGPGSPNVLIEGKPAWRVGSDVHACPLSTGPQPHASGTVPVGSPSVLINGLPAARVGDLVLESGPPNTIILGSTSVLIDDTDNE